MKRKILSLLTVLLAIMLMTSPALAGPGIGLRSVSFSLGSLIANGTLTGLGKADVNVVIDAKGVPAITCTNNGQNNVPGQSYPKVSASGSQLLDGDSTVRKNGKSPFGVETVDPEYLPWDVAGCPNANWTGQIDFIYWTDASISVYDATTGILQLKQDYSCTTTLNTVSCTPK